MYPEMWLKIVGPMTGTPQCGDINSAGMFPRYKHFFYRYFVYFPIDYIHWIMLPLGLDMELSCCLE